MKQNTLSIIIKKPVEQVYVFTTTPPNSSKWIPGIINETTNEWPIKVGTIYSLIFKSGEISKVKVVNLHPSLLIEWESMDGNYHCRYQLIKQTSDSCKLIYDEWVDRNKIAEPFTQDTLKHLKTAIEST
jgi:hypothetical protein